MFKRNILKIREKISKVNILKREKSIYSKINTRYKDKIKRVFLPELPSKEKIEALTSKGSLVIFFNKNRESLQGVSKNVSFQAYFFKKELNFAKANILSDKINSISNLYEIKLFNSFLVNFSKKNKISKITMNTWLFEELKNFDKYLGGYKPVSEKQVINYQNKLKENNVKKALSFDFEKQKLKVMTNDGKINYLNIELPTYFLKV